MLELDELLDGQTIHEVSAEQYIKYLISLLCYPVDEVLNCEEPQKKVLTPEVINKFPVDDLNNFSELFLKHNEHLYKKRITKSKKENGQIVISSKRGDVIHKKHEYELYFEYLYRLLVIERDEWKKRQEEKVAKLIGKTSTLGISKALSSQFDTTYKIGSSVSDRLLQIPSLATSRLSKHSAESYLKQQNSVMDESLIKPLSDIQKSQVFDSATNHVLKQAELLKTIPALPKTNIYDDYMKELSSDVFLSSSARIIQKLDENKEQKKKRELRQLELSEKQVNHSNEQLQVLQDMSGFMQSLNNNQLKAAEESAESTLKSEKISRTGLQINVAVLVMTFLSLLIGGFSVYESYYSSLEESEVQKENKLLKLELQQKEQQLKVLEIQNKRITDLEVKLQNNQVNEVSSTSPTSSASVPK